jgi:hypothetical protein
MGMLKHFTSSFTIGIPVEYLPELLRVELYSASNNLMPESRAGQIERHSDMGWFFFIDSISISELVNPSTTPVLSPLN